MASDSSVKIVIGFDGGQGVDIETTESAWSDLQKALAGSGDGWVTLPGRDDAEYHVSLGKVAWVRQAALARSIGFRD